MNITQAILQQLEGKLAERINEYADISNVEMDTDGTWRAVIHYDGVLNRGYRAEIAFDFRIAGSTDVVEDFKLLNFWGNGLLNRDIKFD